MPYRDKEMDRACKRRWYARQKREQTEWWVAIGKPKARRDREAWRERRAANRTATWLRKKKRNSKTKSQRRRDRLDANYVRAVLRWPDAPNAIVELKRQVIKLKRKHGIHQSNCRGP